MKRRDPVLIQMEILASLSASPKGPTRLAQSCNINYGRIGSFTGPMAEKGLIRAEESSGQEVFHLTDEGYRVYMDWLDVWRRLALT